MFLLAITRYKIAHSFRSVDVEEFKINSSIITIVTDNLLSRYISEPDGFSIIESPLISSPEFRDIIFSQVNYNKDDNAFDIFRSTVSGRPIYYHINPKGDFFCSTHISMLRKAGVRIEENTDVLPEFFVYRYVMPPQTLYRDIKQVVTGSRLCIRLTNGKCKIAQVDQYNPPRPDNYNEESNTVDNISDCVLTSLSKSIQALNPCRHGLCILLSGGLDSSILFKICQAHYEIDTTFSTGYPFEDPENNREKEYALSAADAFGTMHRYYEVTTREYLNGFLEAISMAEEPLHHLQSVMFYLLFKGGLPKDKHIVISGQGADGIFGLTFYNQVFRSGKRIIRLLSKYRFPGLLEFFSHIVGRGQGLISALDYSDRRSLPISDTNSLVWLLGAYGSEDWVSRHFNVTQRDIIEGRYNFIESFEDRSIYDIMSILDFFGDVSVTQSIWAKLGESQRKIVYYPFNNTDMLDFTYSIPWDVRLRKPKNVLRGVARQLKIPDFIISRPKSGFNIRAKHWSEKGETFKPLVPLASKVFDEKQIRDMQSADRKAAMTFWNILNYSIWKRLCIDDEPLEVLLEELKRAESYGGDGATIPVSPRPRVSLRGA